VQAATTTCNACGASVPFEVGLTELRCEHCGASQPIAAGLAEALSSAVADYAVAAEAELRARWVAAFHANNERAANLVIFSVVVIAPLVLVWWFLLAVDAAPSVPSWLALVAVSIVPVSAFGRGLRIMHEMPSLRALALVSTLRCAGCGGWSAFLAGKAADRCTYCGAQRLVPLTLLSAAIDLVRGATADPARPSARNENDRPRDGRWGPGLAIAIPFVIVIVIVPAWVALELLVLEQLPRGSAWWAFAAVGLFGTVDLVRTVLAMRGAMARHEEMEREISQRILAATRQ
jgi:DNA-directed RNA polymerase subunit RPC12/RpoP